MQSYTSNLLNKSTQSIKYISRCIRDNSAVIFVSKLREKNVTVVQCDLAEDRQNWWGTICNHHSVRTWQPSGTLTSLNHRVGLNRHSLLFHLYTASEAQNMPETNEWQHTKCQQLLQQLIIKAAFSSFSPDKDRPTFTVFPLQMLLITQGRGGCKEQSEL